MQAALGVDQDGKPFWDGFTIAAASAWALTGVSLIACLKQATWIADGADTVTVFLNKHLLKDFHLVSEVKAAELIKQYGSIEKGVRETISKVGLDKVTVNRLTGQSLDNEFAKELTTAKYLDGKLSVASYLKYATIALALVSAGLTVAALLKNDEADLPPVPKYMVDSKEDKDGKNYTVNYRAAGSNGLTAFKAEKKNKGPFADTKAYEGSQWLTIYQTKDESAGKPVTPDFVVQEDKQAPSGYDTPLHIIGEKGASNLISAEYMNYSKYETIKNKGRSVYVFYKNADDEGTASAFSGGRLAIIVIAGLAVLVLIAAFVRRSKKNAR